MEEKKLTDEELNKLIKILEYQSWAQNSPELSQAAYMLKQQKAEIERLTEENKKLSIKVWSYERPARTPLYSNESMVNCNFVTCYNENADLKAKNTELQQQVDKLKEENAELYKEHTTLIAGSILEKQDITKYTAKDLLIEFNEWINEHYDAKFDAYCVCIPVDKVSEFLMHKSKEYDVEVE